MNRQRNTEQTAVSGATRTLRTKPIGWLRAIKTATIATVLAGAVGMAGAAHAAVLSDFTLIRGDNAVRIGDGAAVWKQRFSTGGRTGAPAYLILNVKHLTHTPLSVAVRINNTIVGYIRPYAGGWSTAENWYTQMVVFPASVLRDGHNANELEIRAVSYPGATYDNLYDDFFLKDVICHFHQEA